MRVATTFGVDDVNVVGVVDRGIVVVVVVSVVVSYVVVIVVVVIVYAVFAVDDNDNAGVGVVAV